MQVVVSNGGGGKPHPHAVLRQVGVGHKEWFVDSCNYPNAHALIDGRQVQVTYDTSHLTFHVHFLDKKNFTGVSISTLDRYCKGGTFSSFLDGYVEEIREAAKWLGVDLKEFAKTAIQDYLSEIRAAMDEEQVYQKDVG